MNKQEQINELLKTNEELYLVSIDRIVEDRVDKDFLWFVYNDLSDLIWRTNSLIEESRTYDDYVEFEFPDLSKETTTWDWSYTCNFTGETVRFVYLFETVKGLS